MLDNTKLSENGELGLEMRDMHASKPTNATSNEDRLIQLLLADAKVSFLILLKGLISF